MSASVLICVYHRDQPDHVAASLASLVDQTRQADQIVLVKDGPLSPAVQQIVDQFEQGYPDLFTIVTLASNQGLIAALNEGLRHCRGDLVFRMDADDIAAPTRIETQTDFLAVHPEIGVLGSAMHEFDQDPAQPLRLKPVKQDHRAICAQLPYRNPINHPTVVFRRELIGQTGYPELHLLEDYFLWSQLIHAGVRFHNLPEPLVSYRFNDATLRRRSGWNNFRNECWLRYWMYQHGLTGAGTVLLTLLIQAVLRFSPAFVQRWLWQRSRQQQPKPPIT